MSTAADRISSVRPMAGIIVSVMIAGGHPVTAAAGRVGVVAGDPDPASANPLVMAGKPDRAAIGRRPRAFVNHGRRRRADPDADRLRGSLRGTDEGQDDGEKRQ